MKAVQSSDSRGGVFDQFNLSPLDIVGAAGGQYGVGVTRDAYIDKWAWRTREEACRQFLVGRSLRDPSRGSLTQVRLKRPEKVSPQGPARRLVLIYAENPRIVPEFHTTADP